MTKTPRLSRRAVLKAAGVCIALPWLEASASGGSEPVRTLIVIAPNGVSMDDYFPAQVGPLELTYPLQPLQRHASRVAVLSGFDSLSYNELEPVYDPHANTMAALLTGVVPKPHHLEQLRLAPSFDQVLGHANRPPGGVAALSLSSTPFWDVNATTTRELAWSTAASFDLDGREVRAVREVSAATRLLFGETGVPEARRLARAQRRASALDLVLDQLHDLESKLGHDDLHRLDQYVSALREVEDASQRESLWASCPAIDGAGAPSPVSITSPAAHIRQLGRVACLALACDRTRVVTQLLDHGGSSRTFVQLGMESSHHDLSHHTNDPATLLKLREIDRWYSERFADILDELVAFDVQGEPLLNSCQVLYVNEQRDGNLHDATDLPVILAGKIGGMFRLGHFQRVVGSLPISDLYLWLMQNVGVRRTSFGERSTGQLVH